MRDRMSWEAAPVDGVVGIAFLFFDDGFGVEAVEAAEISATGVALGCRFRFRYFRFACFLAFTTTIRCMDEIPRVV